MLQYQNMEQNYKTKLGQLTRHNFQVNTNYSHAAHIIPTCGYLPTG